MERLARRKRQREFWVFVGVVNLIYKEFRISLVKLIEGWNGFDLQKTHGLVLSGCNLADAPVLQPTCGFYLEIASPVGFGKYFTQFPWCRNQMGLFKPSCSSGYNLETEFARPFLMPFE